MNGFLADTELNVLVVGSSSDCLAKELKLDSKQCLGIEWTFTTYSSAQQTLLEAFDYVVILNMHVGETPSLDSSVFQSIAVQKIVYVTEQFQDYIERNKVRDTVGLVALLSRTVTIFELSCQILSHNRIRKAYDICCREKMDQYVSKFGINEKQLFLYLYSHLNLPVSVDMVLEKVWGLPPDENAFMLLSRHIDSLSLQIAEIQCLTLFRFDSYGYCMSDSTANKSTSVNIAESSARMTRATYQ